MNIGVNKSIFSDIENVKTPKSFKSKRNINFQKETSEKNLQKTMIAIGTASLGVLAIAGVFCLKNKKTSHGGVINGKVRSMRKGRYFRL